MQEIQVSDINVIETAVLPAPEYLCREIKRTESQADFVVQSRNEINNIVFGGDKRLLLIVGPCSIHDADAGIEYAKRLAALSREVDDRILIVMRVYFEKPRTTTGWKGLIMDPQLDGSGDLFLGLKLARQVLRSIIDLKLPTATELLDPITPQYVADLISWSAIGARTTESQTHRQMASGLSMPLGFKNLTSGAVQPAINAIKAARQPQTFLGISHQGLASAVTTRGNPNCHVILRGGDHGPNFSAESISNARDLLKQADLLPSVMIDCSHGNSAKDHRRQPDVLRSVVTELISGNDSIIGAMLESNLEEGSQRFPQPKENLKYGQSITDACINWATTESLIREVHGLLSSRLP
jgi:3-deoxy-7-phosphoheptulonate synthase